MLEWSILHVSKNVSRDKSDSEIYSILSEHITKENCWTPSNITIAKLLRRQNSSQSYQSYHSQYIVKANVLFSHFSKSVRSNEFSSKCKSLYPFRWFFLILNLLLTIGDGKLSGMSSNSFSIILLGYCWAFHQITLIFYILHRSVT